LKQADSTTLRVMMGTADWDEAMRRARPIIERAVLEGRLLANSRAARVYEAFDVPEFWADVARAGGIPHAQYEVEREVIAQRWNFPVWIIDRLAKREARPLKLPGYRTRRYRLRKGGQPTVMGGSWHYRRGGKKYFFQNGNVMCVRMYIEGRVYQWSLQTRSKDQAARIAGPIGLARDRVRRAAIKLIDCKPGSLAADAALADCAKACRRLSEAIRKAGGPIELVNFVLEPPPLPADVMMPSKSQPKDLVVNPAQAEARPRQAAAVTAAPPAAVMSRAERKAMREASLTNAEERYFQLIETQPNKAPEGRAALEQKMMHDFKVTRDDARYCRAKAIKRYSSLHPDNPCNWGEAGR